MHAPHRLTLGANKKMFTDGETSVYPQSKGLGDENEHIQGRIHSLSRCKRCLCIPNMNTVAQMVTEKSVTQSFITDGITPNVFNVEIEKQCRPIQNGRDMMNSKFYAHLCQTYHNACIFNVSFGASF